ncbi:hypothetical protein EVA_20022 [gut metagenome]|uniref:Uncharacterized protein n=1 Tax=gut metagenome TaxID=749906 RepID=J9FBR3_9ZZZZ
MNNFRITWNFPFLMVSTLEWLKLEEALEQWLVNSHNYRR